VDFSPFLVNHGIAGPPHPEKSAYRHVGIGRFPVDDNPVYQDLAQRQLENHALCIGHASSMIAATSNRPIFSECKVSTSHQNRLSSFDRGAI